MTVLAIDPGPKQSGWVTIGGPLDGIHLIRGAVVENYAMLEQIAEYRQRFPAGRGDGHVVIEQIESFGMAVGKEVFSTVHWAGRFHQAADPLPVCLMPRREVKLALCQSMKATDANIRMALLDRYGGPGVAKGTKTAPGPLYGIKTHLWAALALAVTYLDRR